MVEIRVCNYLKTKFDVPVLMEAPEVPSSDYPEEPGKYLIVEKTGESVSNHIHQANIAVQSYGSSLYEVVSLDAKMRDAMENVIELNDIYSCRLNSSYNFTDTRKKKHRYQSVFTITF